MIYISVLPTLMNTTDDTYILADTFRCKVLQQLQLSQRPQGKHGVVEWSDLLDGDLGVAGSV